MNYPYVLLSEQDGRFYIGSTCDLRARLQKHSSAQCVPLPVLGPCV
jgi:predicted GIY-YIG superfamily endonuclease